jgi:localization factor PodJL
LGQVLELVSEERLAALLGTVHMPDSESIAASVARRLLERAPAAGGDDLARSIADFIDERRENDAQIAAMLDTMQQAMVRILDRLDGVEPERADPLPSEPSPAPRSEPAAPAIDVSRLSSATVGQSAPQDHGPSRGEAAECAETHASAPTPVAATPQGTRTTIDKIRQDLIADAQRAKMRVAAEAERARGSRGCARQDRRLGRGAGPRGAD